MSNAPSLIPFNALRSGPVWAALIALASLLAWEASGADMAMARWFGTATGFPLRDNWFLVRVVHESARVASWIFLALLGLGIWWPRGVLRRLDRAQRVQLVATVLASVLVVTLLKQASPFSCPWDLKAFGGVAIHLPHWNWRVRDGGPGGCFPAGHASAAFALLGGYFVFRPVAPLVARGWLAVVVVLGLILGIGQQMRGAHFMGHTLWTAWVCWVVALIIDKALPHASGYPPTAAADRHAKH